MPFVYKDVEYELKPLTLGVKAAVIDIFNERNRLIKEATKDVDVKKIEKHKADIERLELKIEQKTELGEDTINLEKQLCILKDAGENNTELQAEIRFYEAQLQSVMLGLMYNEKLMNKIIPSIVDKPVKLDFEDLSTEKFVFEVISDFFFRIGMSNS